MSSWGKLGISLGLGIAGFALMGPVGFSLGFLGGTVVGSMIFPEKQKGQYPSWGDYPVQTAEKGTPIPELAGTRRIAGNIIWMGPLKKYIVEHSSGKGGGGEAVSYEVICYRSFLIGVVMGPAELRNAWAGKTKMDLDSPTCKLTWFDGSDNVGIPELTGEEYTSCKKLACAYLDNYYLGNSEQIPNFIFEVSSLSSGWDIGEETAPYEASDIDMDWALPLPNGNVFHVYILNNNLKFTILDEENNEVVAVTTIQTSITYSGPVAHAALLPDSGNVVICYNKSAKSYFVIYNQDGNVVKSATEYQTPSYASIAYLGTIRSGIYSDNWFICWRKSSAYPSSFYYAVWNAVGNVILAPTVWYTATSYSNNLVIRGVGSTFAGVMIFLVGHSSADKRYLYTWDILGNSISGQVEYDASYSGGDLCCGFNDTNYFAIVYSDVNITKKSYFQIREAEHGALVVGPVELLGNTNVGISYWWSKMVPLGSNICLVITAQLNDTVPSCYDCWWGILKVNGEWVRELERLNEVDADIQQTHLEVSVDETKLYVTYTTYDNCWFRIMEYVIKKDVPFSTIIKSVMEAQLPQIPISENNFFRALSYCQFNDLEGSFYFKEQQSLWDWIDYICSHFNAFRYRSNGKLCLGIFRDEDSIATLTKDDFVLSDGSNARPIIVSKRKYKESYNRIEVNWTDRDNEYASSVAPAADSVDKRISAIQRKNSVKLDGITNGELAQIMAYRLLAESLYRIHYYTFNISFKNSLYEINDVLTLNDGTQVIDKKVRITGVQEHLTGLQLSIEAVEEIIYPNVLFGKQKNEHTPDTPPVLDDGLVEFREDYENARTYLSITPTSEDTNGWWIYFSYDNYTYELVGRCGIAGITGGDANSQGSLLSVLPAHPSVTHAPDESFEVNIGTLTDLRTGITDDEFFNNRVLTKIEDEIIAYKDCEETATPGIWTVSNLIRGLFGTEAVAHEIDASGIYSFKTLKSNFSYAIQPSDIGKTLYFKVVSYYGNLSQELSDVDPYEVQIKGEYARPGGVSLLRLTPDELDGGEVTYSGASFTLYWNLPGQKGTGFNQGGFDLNNDYPIWEYGDDVSELIGGNGVVYGNYVADANLQGIDLVFEQTDGTFISERSIAATATYTTITKATDLGGFDSAVIKVIPKTSYKSTKEASITVTQV